MVAQKLFAHLELAGKFNLGEAYAPGLVVIDGIHDLLLDRTGVEAALFNRHAPGEEAPVDTVPL